MAVGRGDLDHVQESLGGYQRRLGSTPFYQRIGGKRGAMDDDADILGHNVGIADLDPIQDGLLWCRMVG